MKGQTFRITKPFQSLKECCETTGLSVYYLRCGIKNGTVPYITSGTKYLVNVPALLRQLKALPAEENE